MMRNYMTVDHEGVIRPFYLSIKNPLYLNGDAGSWGGNALAGYLLREEPVREKGSRLSDIPRGGAHLNPFKDAEDITRLREISEMGDEESNEAMRDFLIGKGYDGIVYENDVEVSPDREDNRSYIAFYPNQIKSAAPETYNDAGNVIPLSERFNPTKDDVRFSIGNAVDIDSPATVKEGFAPEDLDDDGYMALPRVKKYVQSIKVPERITSMSQAVNWTYKTLGRIRGTFNRLYGEKGKKRGIVRVF